MKKRNESVAKIKNKKLLEVQSNSFLRKVYQPLNN